MASQEHQQLATTIKGIHQELRALSATVGVDEAWRQHLRDEETLKKYATSMRELAEKHWISNESTDDRIHWTVNFCDFYFQQNEIERWRQKDLRTIEKMKEDGCKVQDQPDVILIAADKLEALDVGSSGNFFKRFERFNLLPIDISPSHDSVYMCDFLSVPVESHLELAGNIVKSLPSDHFHVVFFCLLLEYMPSSYQRLKCCEKAYQTLKTHGLLIIITPDSNHQLKNSKQIKNWRWTLARIGFQRIKVEKLTNLTCMAFRKCSNPEITHRWAEQHTEEYMEFKLEIPQDKIQHDI